jgi:hypothetical protein
VTELKDILAIALMIGGPIASAASAWYAVKFGLRGITVLVERMEKTLYRGNGEVSLVEQVHEHGKEVMRLTTLAEQHAMDIGALREETIRLRVEREIGACPLRPERADRGRSGERRSRRSPSRDRARSPRPRQ